MGERDMEEARGRGRQERYRGRYKICGRDTQGERERHTGGARERHRGGARERHTGEVQDTWEGHTGEVNRGRYEGGGM